ncbi:hypothetical protein OG496_17155 [Streptomyces sp. NBC_00988]|uniref:hypothetical protein n=1 Tax=Streptomyces sp. NBC_00988 TaxID=2903704 RepID=UPI00386A6248|nr:hypothetical protein OG496_17155 [Streptomyces sp. NBC_00988]
MAAHETNESGRGQEQGRDAEGGDGDAHATRTHLSAAGLRARGWTAGMVRQLLGEPDLLRVNPHVRAAPRIRLYCVERVEAAERSEEFRAVSAAAARRSAATRVAARRRRREVLARIAAEPIDVPRLAPHRLAALAVEHRERRDEERAYERRGLPPDDTPVKGRTADAVALDRWKVDYLLHRLARYDELLNGLHGGAGRATAEELLRRRIHAAITEAYPFLAQECEHQLSGGNSDAGASSM